MDIEYVNQSRFLGRCEEAIREGRAELAEGGVIHVTFEGGGYPGRVVITISSGASGYFGSDWEGSDQTRFPARIKAAATALRNCELLGRYEVIHEDGSLNIRRA